ncbi:MAG: hypothetical protein NTU73_04845 [Ignavibacteriae bacterium]|nr:hypothetical protein [Ignavibacteriota bacterium]
MNKLLVVSSKVGGIASTFNDDEILFVENNEVDSYVKAILNVTDDVQKYNMLRENLNKKIINYNWESVKDKWIRILYNYEM